MLAMRQAHGVAFGKSDMFFLMALKPEPGQEVSDAGRHGVPGSLADGQGSGCSLAAFAGMCCLKRRPAAAVPASGAPSL